jgi:uncharacterized protein
MDRAERTDLHYAALENDLARAESRLSAGDDPNARDAQGFTPLHLACQENAVEVAQLLLHRGADADSVNSFGNTPLFTAVFNYRGDGSVIELLRNHGADPSHVNESGQSPVGLARLIANHDVARLFDDLA